MTDTIDTSSSISSLMAHLATGTLFKDKNKFLLWVQLENSLKLLLEKTKKEEGHVYFSNGSCTCSNKTDYINPFIFGCLKILANESFLVNFRERSGLEWEHEVKCFNREWLNQQHVYNKELSINVLLNELKNYFADFFYDDGTVTSYLNTELKLNYNNFINETKWLKCEFEEIRSFLKSTSKYYNYCSGVVFPSILPSKTCNPFAKLTKRIKLQGKFSCSSRFHNKLKLLNMGTSGFRYESRLHEGCVIQRNFDYSHYVNWIDPTNKITVENYTIIVCFEGLDASCKVTKENYSSICSFLSLLKFYTENENLRDRGVISKLFYTGSNTTLFAHSDSIFDMFTKEVMLKRRLFYIVDIDFGYNLDLFFGSEITIDCSYSKNYYFGLLFKSSDFKIKKRLNKLLDLCLHYSISLEDSCGLVSELHANKVLKRSHFPMLKNSAAKKIINDWSSIISPFGSSLQLFEKRNCSSFINDLGKNTIVILPFTGSVKTEKEEITGEIEVEGLQSIVQPKVVENENTTVFDQLYTDYCGKNGEFTGVSLTNISKPSAKDEYSKFKGYLNNMLIKNGPDTKLLKSKDRKAQETLINKVKSLEVEAQVEETACAGCFKLIEVVFPTFYKYMGRDKLYIMKCRLTEKFLEYIKIEDMKVGIKNTEITEEMDARTGLFVNKVKPVIIDLEEFKEEQPVEPVKEENEKSIVQYGMFEMVDNLDDSVKSTLLDQVELMKKKIKNDLGNLSAKKKRRKHTSKNQKSNKSRSVNKELKNNMDFVKTTIVTAYQWKNNRKFGTKPYHIKNNYRKKMYYQVKKYLTEASINNQSGSNKERKGKQILSNNSSKRMSIEKYNFIVSCLNVMRYAYNDCFEQTLELCYRDKNLKQAINNMFYKTGLMKESHDYVYCKLVN